MNGVEEILIKLGYDLRNENSNYWRAIPKYRESNNITSLRISKEKGSFIDFAANIKGNLFELVRLTLGLDSIKEAKIWTDGLGFENLEKEKKPKIKLDKKIDIKYIDGLMPHYSFYESEPRSIKKETITQFECGVCFSGKQSNRFVFVIRNEDGEVLGVAGRDLLSYEGRTKWKLLGDKRKWVFPLSAEKYIKEKKKVVLVESIGDMLALYDIGVKNVMVLFGIDISNKLLNWLSTLEVDEIVISTNNDSKKEKNWGEIAANAIKIKMSKLIDEDKIKIVLPPEGDWADLKKEERTKYAEQIRN